MMLPESNSNTCDFLIIGGGIVGISIAREIKLRYRDAKVVVLEKESGCGQHASSRNSGVLHAGFYYSPDSLKAKMTCAGNIEMSEYCHSRKIPVLACGKLVVARNSDDLPTMDILLARGKENGVPLESISEEEAKEIEPRVKTYKRAIFSPTTSSVDPVTVLAKMYSDALQEGVIFALGEQFIGAETGLVKTSKRRYFTGYVINAAGLYADKIAREYGFSKNYRILPFKGLYLYSDEPVGALRTHIYPVPDLSYPFLGVHFTLTSGQKIKIGPTAIPAFWREQYDGFQNFAINETLEIVYRQLGLIFSANFDFKTLAITEIKKYTKPHLVDLASELLTGVSVEKYTRWGKPGIRAQLIDIRKRRLEMDFVLEGDSKSLHVLNAVSPGFTCAIPFARHICDEMERLS